MPRKAKQFETVAEATRSVERSTARKRNAHFRSLREIASQLERLHERTPRGGSKCSPSSVKNLPDRARRTHLLDTEAA